MLCATAADAESQLAVLPTLGANGPLLAGERLAAERGKQAALEFGQQLSTLKAEKEERERRLAESLESTRTNAQRQADQCAA